VIVSHQPPTVVNRCRRGAGARVVLGLAIVEGGCGCFGATFEARLIYLDHRLHSAHSRWSCKFQSHTDPPSSLPRCRRRKCPLEHAERYRTRSGILDPGNTILVIMTVADARRFAISTWAMRSSIAASLWYFGCQQLL
jgi:hypothetical protein